MRKLVVYNFVSLDGMYSGLNNDGTELFPMMGDTFYAYNAELLRNADYFLIGRASYELFTSYWSEVAEDPASDRWTDEERDIVDSGEDVLEIVVSDTLSLDTKDVEVVRRAAVYDRIAELKAGDGKDILMTGSRTLWNDLMEHGCVDELHLMIGNEVLGVGTPLFVGKPHVALHLRDVRTWDGVDTHLAVYAVGEQ